MIIESIKMSWKNIIHNKMRSFLTILGIVIGVTSSRALITIVEGVTNEMTEMIVPPGVIRKSTVGAGDSMVAGIVYYLSIGKTIHEAAQYGVACGTAATMNPGTELCRKVDVEKLYLEIKEPGFLKKSK